MFSFILTGCSNENNSQEVGEKTLKRKRILDFEKPEGKPVISGILKGIIGNEATILKIERPDKTNKEGEERIEKKDVEKIKKPSSGFRGGGGMGIGQKMNTSEMTDEKMKMLKSMSVGEEKVIIPVGIKMLKGEDKKMIEASLEDITKDKMLMIWTDTSITDRNIANFVIIN